VTMDGDLQNDPFDIPMFLEKIEGRDRCRLRMAHKDRTNLLPQNPFRCCKLDHRKITGVPIRDNGLLRESLQADVIKEVPLYSDMHRFIPAMASCRHYGDGDESTPSRKEIRRLEIRNLQNLQGDHRLVGDQDDPFLHQQPPSVFWRRCCFSMVRRPVVHGRCNLERIRRKILI